MLKEGRYVFTYPSLFLNLCYRTYFFSWIICRFIRSPYLCNVFFIVLDLRLTKVGVQRNSFFYAHFRVVFPFVFVRKKTPLRSIQNALAFELKRPCV